MSCASMATASITSASSPGTARGSRSSAGTTRRRCRARPGSEARGRTARSTGSTPSSIPAARIEGLISGYPTGTQGSIEILAYRNDGGEWWAAGWNLVEPWTSPTPFEINSLPAGTYRVCFSSQDFEFFPVFADECVGGTRRWRPVTDIEVVAGETTSGADVELGSASTIRGRVAGIDAPVPVQLLTASGEPIFERLTAGQRDLWVLRAARRLLQARLQPRPGRDSSRGALLPEQARARRRRQRVRGRARKRRPRLRDLEHARRRRLDHRPRRRPRRRGHIAVARCVLHAERRARDALERDGRRRLVRRRRSHHRLLPPPGQRGHVWNRPRRPPLRRRRAVTADGGRLARRSARRGPRDADGGDRRSRHHPASQSGASVDRGGGARRRAAERRSRYLVARRRHLLLRWYADGVLLPGATGPSYTPTMDQVGSRIRVRVIASKAGYPNAGRTSAPTAPVTSGP